MADIEKDLQDGVRDALAKKRRLNIVSGNTKTFLGARIEGEAFEVSGHSGIVDYDPKELVMTARCGTSIAEIESALRDANQMLAFEPPRFGTAATLGGTVACGLSGPRRPYAGSCRDHVLGCRMINGRGEILDFGGRVMKNVAGFDASRLMVGAFGTLGILLEVSFKVLPRAASSLTLVHECSDPVGYLNSLSASPLPVDAAAHVDGLCYVRLSGSDQAVSEAKQRLQGELLAGGEVFWEGLREQKLPFFDTDLPLWRIACPPASPMLDLPGHWMIDWGASQRWLKSAAETGEIRQKAMEAGGHAALFRGEGFMQPLTGTLLLLHRNLKSAFDPEGVFNHGRLCPEF